MPQTWKENQAGLNEAYYSHCSFRSPTQALPAEINPRSVLNRLFHRDDKKSGGLSEERREALDRSLLDLVLGGARELRRTLPQSDQQKLDEYLDSVRSVERRIAAIETRQKEAALEKRGCVRASEPMQTRPRSRSRFQKGTSEANTCKSCATSRAGVSIRYHTSEHLHRSTPNGVSYPELGFKDQHHSQTHHNDQPEMVSKVAKITEFNIAQFAYMVRKMHSLREADGTLLDHCIMMWGSGLEDGNKHTRENLPFIVAGRGGGALKTGQFLPNTKGNQGDLLTTLLLCAGIPLDRPIGISTKHFPRSWPTHDRSPSHAAS